MYFVSMSGTIRAGGLAARYRSEGSSSEEATIEPSRPPRFGPAVQADATLARFQAVAEKTRLRIVQLLTGGERCVCELQADLGAAQSRLSFHLKKLKEAGVIADRKAGRWTYYSLIPEALEEMRRFLGEVKPEGRSQRNEACCR